MWSCTQWESLWGEAQAQIGEVGLQLQLCEGWHHTDRHSCSSVHVHRAGWRLRRCNRPLDADTGLACIWYTLGLGRLTWVSQFRPVSVARSSVSAETETLPWLRDRNRNRSRNCASGSFGAETETETEIRSASIPLILNYSAPNILFAARRSQHLHSAEYAAITPPHV